MGFLPSALFFILGVLRRWILTFVSMTKDVVLAPFPSVDSRAPWNFFPLIGECPEM